MKSFVSAICLTAIFCIISRAVAEEKMVTTPLLTALSSTTISGYADTSASWDPATGYLSVTFPNGKDAFITSRDLNLLRWAIKAKQPGFVKSFVRAKQQKANLDAAQFDAKYLKSLLRVAHLQQSIFGATPSPF